MLRAGSSRAVALLLAGLMLGLFTWVSGKSRPIQTDGSSSKKQSRINDAGAIANNRQPNEWGAGDFTFVERCRPFNPDRMKTPTAEQIARWKRAYPLVRPIPYPYLVGLSVPSDCCGSTIQDLYYSSTLISRKFGLDYPSSFWVYGSQPYSVNAALFIANHHAPSRDAVVLEGDTIDHFSLLLTYYYRGWLDHLHQWSNEGGVFYSLVTPRQLTANASEMSVALLELSLQQSHPFEGLEIGLVVDEGVRSFELELTDANDRPHFIVFGDSLKGRPGWDLSSLPREKFRQTYVHLAEEQNTTDGACLGQVNKPHLKSGKLIVRGKPGATVCLDMIRPFDLSRAGVRNHLECMRSWNLLPICSSNHGGFSSWGQLDEWNYSYPYKDSVTNHQYQLDRPGLGARRCSPTYIADLLSDFGVAFHTQVNWTKDNTVPTSPNLLEVFQRMDGGKMYWARRRVFLPTTQYPDVTDHSEHFENLGGGIVRCLEDLSELGQHCILYTHFNYYNGNSFVPAQQSGISMTAVKRLHPYTDHALGVLSCLKYNLDEKRLPHQRVWCCPVSVALRFAQAQRGLVDHARLDANDVHVDPWLDEVTGKMIPDLRFPSQDLHGQTFYVPDSASARVFCGSLELTSLKRNPPDCTGRPSVTVVDTETPTVVFDEVPLEDRGEITSQVNAQLAYPEGDAAQGRRALQIKCDKDGEMAVQWSPFRFDNGETDYLHLYYRKSNPASEMEFNWEDENGREYVVTEGDLRGRQGWEIARQTNARYRELVLEHADMTGPRHREKSIPRGTIKRFNFLLRGGHQGDTIVFDRVEFLSARGLRPSVGEGLVIGGRVSNRKDGLLVQARGAGSVRETRTTHGGWYTFQNVPKDSILEITCMTGRQRSLHPERGRRIQVMKNDLEFHFSIDP